MKENEKQKNLILVLLSLVVMLLWGSLFPVGKLSYEKFEINTKFLPNLLLFAGVRFMVSGLLITFFQGVRQKAVPKISSKREWLGVALVGVFAVMFHYACTYFGLSMVESSKTALLKQSGVLVFIFFSFLFLKEEKFSIGKGIGAVFGIVSIVALNLDELGFSFGKGELLIVLASCCTVISNVVVKKLLKQTDAVTVTGYSELFGGIVLLIIGSSCGGEFVLSGVGDWCLLGYIILATCISYVLWYAIVQKNELSKLFIVKFSEPLFAAIIGAIILQENLWKAQYLWAFIFVGLALVVSHLDFPKLFKQRKKKRITADTKHTEELAQYTTQDIGA